MTLTLLLLESVGSAQVEAIKTIVFKKVVLKYLWKR